MSDSEFSKKLARFLRREYIRQAVVDRGKNGIPLRDDVRNRETQFQLEKFTSELVLVDPFYDGIATDLATELQQRFSSKVVDLGVVLLGSAIHGGAALRSARGATTSSDFDYGLIYAPGSTINESILKTVVLTTDSLLPKIIKNRYNTQISMSSCDHVNPVNYRVSHLTDPENFCAVLQTQQGVNELWEKILYFQPSYPKELNQHNQAVFLEALTRLSQRDSNQWEVVVSRLEKIWHGIHLIKAKHLFDKRVQNPKTALLGLQLETMSPEAMSGPFSRLLRSTAT